MTVPLLVTKFNIPPLPSGRVARPRLLQRLDAGLQPNCRLILVSAPAGYGKTTLLSEWLYKMAEERRSNPKRRLTFPNATPFRGTRDAGHAGTGVSLSPASLVSSPVGCAWLSLDEEDNSPTRFWLYLVAALQRAEPGLGQDVLQILQTTQPLSPQVDLRAILSSLINTLSLLSYGLILVLDDYHLITTPAIYDTLAFFVEHLPPQLRLVLATRSDPLDLPLSRLRARRQVIEIRAADLRFTPDEASHLLNKVLGLDLGREDILALEANTEGWIAGIHMAGLALNYYLTELEDLPPLVGTSPENTNRRIQLGDYIKSLSGKHYFIIDYLADEVLNRQPEPVQRFLRQTSILDRLCGSLCDAVLNRGVEERVSPPLPREASLGDRSPAPLSGTPSFSQQILEYLDRANLFLVPLDNERQWYRYHYLFAELLRARLRQMESATIPDLHRRAAGWYEQHGWIAEAMQHTLAAQDYERAILLVKRYWQLTVNRGEIDQVLGWLKALPAQVVRANAHLSVIYGWLLWLIGQPTELAVRVQDAGRILAGAVAPEDTEVAWLRGSIAVLNSILARYAGNLARAMAYIYEAYEWTRDLPPDLKTGLQGVAQYHLAEAHRLAGDLEQARRVYAEAIPLLEATGITIAVSGAYGHLIKLWQVQGHLRRAYEQGQQALRFIETQENPRQPALAVIHIAVADIFRERNELDAAEKHLTWAMEVGKLSGYLPVTREGGQILARLRLAQGDIAGARAAQQQANLSAQKIQVPALIVETAAAQARLELLLGNVAAAARWAAESGLSSEGSSPHIELEAVTYGALLSAQGNQAAAIQQLNQCLASAEAGGRLGKVIEILILRAIAYHRHKDELRALTDLSRALTLAQPEGYVRIFVDEGQPVSELLLRCRTRVEATVSVYIDQLLAASREPVPPLQLHVVSVQANNLVEPLTERELEVLRLMAAGLSNRDIAAKLVVTEGTVKTHVHNLAGKLGSRSRTQTVARARELGLL